MSEFKDTLFAELSSDIEAFCFDERVSRIFADMIRRSVPGYASVVAMTAVLAAEHVQPDSRVYDLGCSLGTGLIAIQARMEQPCELIGVDNSEAMIQACGENMANLTERTGVQTRLLCEDISEVDIDQASMVIMNYTLQFIEPKKRLALLQKIIKGMRPGGILVLSEKLQFADPATDELLTRLYYDFKKHNGYSQLEISQKRQALENVLIAETREAHFERLAAAGFEQITNWFQCLNFHSFIAFKPAKK